tara:strand:+ start:876 stop:2033 length:1158 start_codon:yes stop_codon:yes gene_type:complete
MKKILFVTTRYPFSSTHSGDRLRSSKILNYLSRNSNIDLIYSDKKRGIKKGNFRGKEIFFKYNSILRIFYIFKSLVHIRPLQNGYFYSPGIKNYIKKNHHKYKTIVFHLIRSAQYLPKNYKGKKILEMTDIYSNNYKQTIKKMSLLNPFFYIYLLEKFLIKNYEKHCSNLFDKIILVSKREILEQNQHINKRKILIIPNGSSINKNVYKFNKKNNKILFVGNIKYLPNKYACYNFVKKILPKINLQFPKIQFHIVGEVNFLDRFFLNTYKNVFVLGPVNNLESIIKKSVCGISNLNIATGFQNKILTYMSFGLPSISSSVSFKGSFFLKKNKDLLVYDNESQFLKYLIILKSNSFLSKKYSKNSFSIVKKKYNWDNILKKYKKIL